MGNCLVTKLSAQVSDNMLPKLGELYLKVVRNDISSQIATMRFGAATSGVKITIVSGGYFCVSQTDSTPINTSIDDSKEIDVLSAKSSGSYYSRLYFQSDEIILLINDKYNFYGIDINQIEGKNFKHFVKYDLDSIKYLPNWVRFTAPISEKISVQDIPSKTILSTKYGTDGNFDGITVGFVGNDYNSLISRGFCIEENVTGTILSINCGCILTGTFTFDIENRTFARDDLLLESPNVYGDITKKLGGYVYLGNSQTYLNVTCNNPLTETPAISSFTLYSSVFTLSMLKNLLNVAGKVNIRLYSTVLTADEVSADSEAMLKVTAYKNEGGSVTINGKTL